MSSDTTVPFDPDTLNARLMRREALRRETQNLNTTTPAGLEQSLAQLSAEVTAEAVERQARDLATAPGARPAPLP